MQIVNFIAIIGAFLCGFKGVWCFTMFPFGLGLFVSAVHFAPYLTGLSSMILI